MISASLLGNGEAQTCAGNGVEKGLRPSQEACSAENKVAGIKLGTGEHRVVEVGMVWKVECVKQGDLSGGESRSGVRAPIVVRKHL